jgi:hypothetical protein
MSLPTRKQKKYNPHLPKRGISSSPGCYVGSAGAAMMFDILQVTQKIRDAAKTKEEAAQQCPNTVVHPKNQSII